MAGRLSPSHENYEVNLSGFVSCVQAVLSGHHKDRRPWGGLHRPQGHHNRITSKCQLCLISHPWHTSKIRVISKEAVTGASRTSAPMPSAHLDPLATILGCCRGLKNTPPSSFEDGDIKRLNAAMSVVSDVNDAPLSACHFLCVSYAETCFITKRIYDYLLFGKWSADFDNACLPSFTMKSW